MLSVSFEKSIIPLIPNTLLDINYTTFCLGPIYRSLLLFTKYSYVIRTESSET